MKSKLLQKKMMDIKQYRFFYNLFMYISLFVMLIIISTSAITNRLYSKNTHDTIEGSNNKILSLTSYNIEFMHHTIDSFLLRLSNDIQVDLVMYTEKTPENALELYKLMEILSSYKTNTDFIQSYYIYNGVSKMYYSIGGTNVMRHSDEMFDQEIVEIIDNLTIDQSKIFLLPRTISETPYSTKNTDEIYTYILPRFDQESKQLIKAYVVNVHASWIKESIHAMTDDNLSDNSSLIIMHSNGIVMAHSNEDLFGEDLSEEGYFKEIQSLGAMEGTIDWEIDGKSYIISYNKSGLKDIVLIGLTEEEELYANLKIINMLTILIMSTLMIIGLGASFLLSKAFYKPISNMNSNLQMLFKNQSISTGDYNDEFQMMRSMVENVHSDLQTLQSFKNVHINTLKEQFIISLFKKKLRNFEAIEQTLPSYELQIDTNKRLQMMMITIDHYYDLIKADKPGEIILKMRGMIDGVLNKIYNYEMVHDMNHFTAILNTPVGSGLTNENEDGLEVMKIIQQVVKDETGYGVTITIGPFIQSLNGLYDAYEITNKLSQSRLVKGHESLIFYFSDSEQIDASFLLPVDETRKMLDYFKAQDETRCFAACQSLVMSWSAYETQDAKLGISYMMLSIIDTINTISNNAHLSFEVEFNALNQYAHSLETLQDVADFFCDTMGSVIERMKENKMNRGHDLIDTIKKYIELHYSDYSMTPNQIASAQGLTLKYANTLFKKDTGLSIAAYINDYRLEQAAKMLTQTNVSVEYILDEVGWENSPYFYTLFKKKYGVTPTIYRVKE